MRHSSLSLAEWLSRKLQRSPQGRASGPRGLLLDRAFEDHDRERAGFFQPVRLSTRLVRRKPPARMALNRVSLSPHRRRRFGTGQYRSPIGYIMFNVRVTIVELAHGCKMCIRVSRDGKLPGSASSDGMSLHA